MGRDQGAHVGWGSQGIQHMETCAVIIRSVGNIMFHNPVLCFICENEVLNCSHSCEVLSPGDGVDLTVFDTIFLFLVLLAVT